jgi:hypothetical protein
MPEQHLNANKVDEAEEDLDLVFPASDETAKVVHPRENSLHLPALSIAAQLAPALTPARAAPAGRDHLDVVLLPGRAVDRAPVVGLAANKPGGELVAEVSARTNLTSWHSVGETLSTNTARGRLLPAAPAMISVPLHVGWGQRRSPLLGARESCIHERFFQFRLSSLVQMPGKPLQHRFQLPVAHPLLESAVAGLVRRIFLRHLAPLCSVAQNPEHSVQHSPDFVTRAATIVRSP